MATGTFKATAKAQGAKRNPTRLSFAAVLVALAASAAVLFSAFFLVKSFENQTGANRQQTQAHDFTSIPTPPASTRTTEQAREAYGRMPLSFEANRGQAGDSVNFVARGAGYTLALSPTTAAFQLRNSGFGIRNVTNDASLISPDQTNGDTLLANPKSDIRNPKSTLLRMNLLGSNPTATVAGQDQLEGRVNYFIGNDPAKWRTDVPTFGRVRYAEVYPGIDVVYYGNQRRLEL